MATTYTDCITFTGETSDFTLKATRKEWNGTVEYSTDRTQWTTWDGTAISSHNKKLYLRGRGNTTFYRSNGARLRLSAKAGCSGNIQTLLEYSNPPTTLSTDNTYLSMFDGCTNLTKAPDLPAVTLTPYCYCSMFEDCTNLTTAPDLPATTLASWCYYNMFTGCTNLTTAPALPATKLASLCYSYMFSHCTSLTTAPKLPATNLASSCYNGMFSGCTSLTQAPALPATKLASSAKSCYANMFSGCTSLTKAPDLPATTLSQNCYNSMFAGCTSLKISATQSSEYSTAWRIPSTGTISSTARNWNYDMLVNTGGTFTSNPSINTTYYDAWSPVETYNITYNLTNCIGVSTNPTAINEGDTATLSFTSNEGYSFPETITVTGVESYTWNKSTGTLILTNATENVNITINCIVVVYPKINSFTYHGKQINNIDGKHIRYVHDKRAGMNNTYEMVYADYLADTNGLILQDANGNNLEFTEA